MSDNKKPTIIETMKKAAHALCDFILLIYAKLTGIDKE